MMLPFHANFSCFNSELHFQDHAAKHFQNRHMHLSLPTTTGSNPHPLIKAVLKYTAHHKGNVYFKAMKCLELLHSSTFYHHFDIHQIYTILYYIQSRHICILRIIKMNPIHHMTSFNRDFFNDSLRKHFDQKERFCSLQTKLTTLVISLPIVCLPSTAPHNHNPPPPETNIEPEHAPLEKGNTSTQTTNFWGSMFIFRWWIPYSSIFFSREKKSTRSWQLTIFTQLWAIALRAPA